MWEELFIRCSNYGKCCPDVHSYFTFLNIQFFSTAIQLKFFAICKKNNNNRTRLWRGFWWATLLNRSQSKMSRRLMSMNVIFFFFFTFLFSVFLRRIPRPIYLVFLDLLIVGVWHHLLEDIICCIFWRMIFHLSWNPLDHKHYFNFFPRISFSFSKTTFCCFS